MKWEEIRKLYPNQYVMLEELQSSINGNKKYIEDIALIKTIQDPKEATKALVNSRGKRFVYHTGKDKIVMEIIIRPGLRGLTKK